MISIIFNAGASGKKVEAPDSVYANPEEMIMADAILSRYIPWTNVEFNGKVRMSSGLPISPTVKMYMEHDNLIQLSVRVPFMGEIARLELDRDSVLIINKYNRNYCKESTSKIAATYPGFITSIQNLFLGRIQLFGIGELDASNIKEMNFQNAGGNEWIVYPKEMPGDGKLQYGYVVTSNGRTKSLYAQPGGRQESLLLNYNYPGSGMSMDIMVDTNKRKMSGTLEFNTVRWGGERMSPLNLTTYQRLGIKDFIKAVRF